MLSQLDKSSSLPLDAFGLNVRDDTGSFGGDGRVYSANGNDDMAVEQKEVGRGNTGSPTDGVGHVREPNAPPFPPRLPLLFSLLVLQKSSFAALMDDGGPVRTPFRPLHQQIHSPNAKDRLKDSPMDFSYDSPPRVAPNTAASSSAWLEAGPDEARKRPREAPERTEAFAFGGRGSSTGSSGAFLFHQPLSPTIAGPDVEMSSETTPTKPVAPVAAVKDAKDSSTQAESSSSSRPLASSGALTRVSRSRGAGGLRGAGSSEQRRSHSQTTSRRKARSAPKDDNDDDEWEADDPPKSLRRRMGDTMNIQYVFGGDAVGGNMEKRRGWSWLEPEWCLGMAQFAFNSVLLVGVLWLVYGVVRTLQRDVADKVHEYELGE